MKPQDAIYAISLPERTLRAASALTGGLLRETSELALPPGVRNALLYRVTAGIGLRFMIEQLGHVRGIYPEHDPISRKFVVRYAVGSSIEVLSLLNFYVSPVWVLAALGDVTRASRTLFIEIGAALQQEGLLSEDAPLENMAQLLDSLERTASHLATTVNMPPLDIGSLRQEWGRLRSNLERLPGGRLPSAMRVERSWSELRSVSSRLKRPVFHVSRAMGASALKAVPPRLQRLSDSAAIAARTAGLIVGGAFLDHYAEASKEIAKTGASRYWAAHSRPYLVAAIRNFLPEKQGWTERIAGR